MLAGAPDAAAAQDPVPPDTVPPADTVVVIPDDDLPDPPPTDPLAADSLRIPTMPVIGAAPDTGWVEGEFHWDREGLLSSTASTLGDLLARVPGLHVLRLGYIGAPETVTTAGGAGGAVEVTWDGMRLDPVAAATLDLGRIDLAAFESVRVSRGLDVVRISLTSRVADDVRPYSRVGAATGDFDTEVFTGVALIPKVFWGPLGLGVTRVETDGRGGVEGAVALGAFAHWGVTRERWGVRLQGRMDDLKRDEAHPLASDSRRVDVSALVTATPAEGVTVEAYVGRTDFDVELPDTLEEEPEEEDPPVVVEPPPQTGMGTETSRADSLAIGEAGPRMAWPVRYQAGARVGVARGPAYLVAEGRWREEGMLPSLELGVRGSVSLLDRIYVAGGVSHDRWSEGPDAANAWEGRGALRLIGGLEATAAVGGGDIGVPATRAAPEDSTLVFVTSPRRSRLGARLTLGPLRVAGGRVKAEADSVATLGLGFDPRGVALPGTDVQGWEVSGKVSAGSWPFRVEGWLEDWPKGATGPYVPVRSWRAGLVYDHLPLESDNLHIYAGLFHSRRGAAFYPVPHVAVDPDEVDPPAADLVEVPGVQTLDFLLNIRVVQVRIYLRWENTLREAGEVFPGRPILQQRVITGIRWDFFN